MEVTITFDDVTAFLIGDKELTLTSIELNGKPYSIKGLDFHQGITISPVNYGSSIKVKATADGESYEETYQCANDPNRFHMSYVPPAAESPDYLWNNAAAAIAQGNILGSSLREAANSGWAREWLSLYYFGSSDPDPKYITDRTHDI